MHYLSRFFIPLFLVTAAPLSANAVLAPLSPPAPVQDRGTSKLIERGGTVDLFDPVKRILIVDNVRFSLPNGPVKINPPVNSKTGDRSFQLKPKMQIRFTTSRENSTARHEVKEIWVTTLSSPIFKK